MKSFQIDVEIENDLEFLIDDEVIQILKTPGHTKDSLSFYIPNQKILIASEAIGTLDYTGYLFSDFLVDYKEYTHSIELMEPLTVELLCQGHNMVFTGEDARSRLRRSRIAAINYAKMLKKILAEENGNVEKAFSRVKKQEYDPRPQPKQMEAVYDMNLKAKIKTILNQL